MSLISITIFFKRISFVVNVAQKFVFIEPVGTRSNVLHLIAVQFGREGLMEVTDPL